MSKKKAPKASRRKTRSELLELVTESEKFLELSGQSYDAGFEAEAKRIAVTLRVLLHDTQVSHSLLGQLRVKDRLSFLDSADPINPRNLMSSPGLVFMRSAVLEDGSLEGRYLPKLGMGPAHSYTQAHFAGWWNDPVMKLMPDGHTWCRRTLVMTLANREGGAHVDPSLDARYESLAKRNKLGWSVEGPGVSAPFVGDVFAAGVRQIGYEVVETLRAGKTLLR